MNSQKFTTISYRSIQTVKAHVPLIRFRKSVIENSGTTNQNTEMFSKKSFSAPVIEHFQLPFKYRRQPLDEAEINAINSGGVY